MTTVRIRFIPYKPPKAIVNLVRRFNAWENFLQKPLHSRTMPQEGDSQRTHKINWSTVESSVIATVVGGVALATLAAIGYITWQVPRQQEQILANQAELRKLFDGIINRLERLEFNDRRQDEKLIRSEHMYR